MHINNCFCCGKIMKTDFTFNQNNLIYFDVMSFDNEKRSNIFSIFKNRRDLIIKTCSNSINRSHKLIIIGNHEIEFIVYKNFKLKQIYLFDCVDKYSISNDLNFIANTNGNPYSYPQYNSVYINISNIPKDKISFYNEVERINKLKTII